MKILPTDEHSYWVKVVLLHLIYQSFHFFLYKNDKWKNTCVSDHEKCERKYFTDQAIKWFTERKLYWKYECGNINLVLSFTTKFKEKYSKEKQNNAFNAS